MAQKADPFIFERLKNQGRKHKWLAEQLGIEDSAFVQLAKKSISEWKLKHVIKLMNLQLLTVTEIIQMGQPALKLPAGKQKAKSNDKAKKRPGK